MHTFLYRHDLKFDINWKSYLDAILGISTIALSIYLVYYPQDITVVKVWAMFSLMKCFRFIVYFFRFDRRQLKSNVIYPGLRYIYDLSLQIFVIFLIFASIGLNFFGGNINSFSLDVYNEDMGTDLDYERLNLNTFANSLVFLFVVMMNNDWPVLTNICIINNSKGNRRILRFLFIFFKFFVNYLLLNSIVASLLEILYEYQKKQKAKGIKQNNLDLILGEDFVIDEKRKRD